MCGAAFSTTGKSTQHGDDTISVQKLLFAQAVERQLADLSDKLHDFG